MLATLLLRNPTAWDKSVVVEIPTGHIAAPGIIDWSQVHLLADDGSEAPFAIREGRPHWCARLAAPVKAPRAEDLLVLSAAPRRDAWSRIRVVAGRQRDASALREQAGQWIVSYSNLEVAVESTTGRLIRLVAGGESFLDRPLEMKFWRLAGAEGKRKSLTEAHARLVAKSTTAAMTELHFLMELDRQLSMALTYRIHACGLVEIWVDERPWKGVSPWVDHAGDIKLSLGGPAEILPHMVNRGPYFGFKDFASAVEHTAAIHRKANLAVLELGEETTNGRRWNRRLYFLPGDPARAAVLADAIDKGIVVDVEPRSMALPAKELRVACLPQAHIAAEVLNAAFKKRGIAEPVPAKTEAEANIVLRLVASRDAAGIEGDGFEIRPNSRGDKVVITACTRFGLVQAALRTAEYLAKPTAVNRVPLVASNPAVALRAGGFGGGPWEVDFPYGSQRQWEEALQRLVASGMNTMADLGMWSNWKMPVSYRYMPELRSTDRNAYDEASGASLAGVETYRRQAQRLLAFAHDRGVKVWLWLPVGCVPTTYACTS